MTSCRYLFSPSRKDRLRGLRRSQLGKGAHARKATETAVQGALRIAPFAHPHKCLPFLISIPMKRLLLAVGDARQVRAGVELMPRRIHSTSKLSLQNHAVIRHPLRQVVIDFSDHPVVIADVAGDSKQEGEHGTNRATDESNQGVHDFEYLPPAGPLAMQAVDLALARAQKRRLRGRRFWLCYAMARVGIEPTTPRFSVVCSTN
jgi:hypothetical protein